MYIYICKYKRPEHVAQVACQMARKREAIRDVNGRYELIQIKVSVSLSWILVKHKYFLDSAYCVLQMWMPNAMSISILFIIYYYCLYLKEVNHQEYRIVNSQTEKKNVAWIDSKLFPRKNAHNKWIAQQAKNHHYHS